MPRWIIILPLLLMVLPAYAQDSTEPAAEATEEATAEVAAESTEEAGAPQQVEVFADDLLPLRADFYLQDSARPTVILLHQLYTTRASWEPVIAPLLDNGYNLLIVDVRGHGTTRGAINWYQAVDDVQVWFDWLREDAGVRPDTIMTMGSSMGSTLAIVGCANDPLCPTAVAISPGWDYYRISVADSVTQKPVFAVYAERDRYPSLGVPRMVEAAPEMVTVRLYEGNAHGMDLLKVEFESLMQEILDWFALHVSS